MDIQQFEVRKREHIRHALDPVHQARGLNGLEQIHLFHEALPELDFQEVRLESPCMGRSLSTPFYVAGMTAGHPDAPAINRVLARACERRGWAMGVGSQRRELEGGGPGEDPWKELRKEVPGLFLMANLGASQLLTAGLEQMERLVTGLQADALVIHANALQEALQPEGTPRFRGVLGRLKEVCKKLPVPVILKETGCGFSESTLRRLSEIGLAAVDVSGLGGTHWGRIEGARARESANPIQAEAAETFAQWGEPTVEAVMAATRTLEVSEIWASGGVRSGLDAAKLIALGAHRVGYAQPALQAALEGPESLLGWMERQEFELKVALFCTGTASPAELRRKEGVWKIRQS